MLATGWCLVVTPVRQVAPSSPVHRCANHATRSRRATEGDAVLLADGDVPPGGGEAGGEDDGGGGGATATNSLTTVPVFAGVVARRSD